MKFDWTHTGNDVNAFVMAMLANGKFTLTNAEKKDLVVQADLAGKREGFSIKKTRRGTRMSIPVKLPDRRTKAVMTFECSVEEKVVGFHEAPFVDVLDERWGVEPQMVRSEVKMPIFQHGIGQQKGLLVKFE